MRNDQIFVLLLVILLPMSGCFDGSGVGEAEGEDSEAPITPLPTLQTHYSSITPTNERCGDYDVCVWEHAMTINATSNQAIEVVSFSSSIEGTYYESYDGSTRSRVTVGTAYSVSSCASGHSWNNSLQLTDYHLLNAFIPTVGDDCQHDIFVQGVHTGSSQSNTNITEIQFSLTWQVQAVTLV